MTDKELKDIRDGSAGLESLLVLLNWKEFFLNPMITGVT